MKPIFSLLIITIFLVVAFPLPASANAGVPMIGYIFEGGRLVFIPIVAIESYVLLQVLNITLERAVFTSFLANLGSTFLGLPLTWLCLVGIEILTGGDRDFIDPYTETRTPYQKILAFIRQSPWLLPYKNENLKWMIPAAGLILLIPFFFASWFIEYKISQYLLPEITVNQLNLAMFWANIITYFMLAIWVLIRFLKTPKQDMFLILSAIFLSPLERKKQLELKLEKYQQDLANVKAEIEKAEIEIQHPRESPKISTNLTSHYSPEFAIDLPKNKLLMEQKNKEYLEAEIKAVQRKIAKINSKLNL